MKGTERRAKNNREKSTCISAVRDYVYSLKPGPLPEIERLEQLLANCWNELDGGNEYGMADHKLVGRMESVRWEPPILTFVLERHGRTALGSTRAELQTWVVDITKGTALVEKTSPRQLYPMQSRLKLQPFVEEIAKLILQGGKDSRLKWYPDGSVRVLISKILPTTIFKQTQQSRRMRFQKALESILVTEGWVKLTSGTYRRLER
jgi:hypothetical protein